MAEERVGLVLAGGGARGAYEVGALSVLLPALEERGQRPTVLVGRASGRLMSLTLLPTLISAPATPWRAGSGLWRSLRWEQVLAPLLAPSIFVEGQPLPSEDIGQAIDYVATWLEDEHLRASAAIPVLFPAVHVSGPPWGTWLVRRLGAQHRWEHW